MIKQSKLVLIAVALVSILFSCEKITPDELAENEVLDGTIELTLQEKQQFAKGDEAFVKIFTAEDGLGPIFVETSCITCHVGDGRGHPFSELSRFSYTSPSGITSPLEEIGGPQLQHRSIPGHDFESIPSVSNGVTRLLAPPNTGLGFLEAVSDATILNLADPNDANNDGISGVPHYVYAPSYYVPYPHNQPNGEGKYIGRFGRKAGAINLLIQTAGAYNQDMGITSEFNPDEPQGSKIAAHEPDITNQEIDDVVFYLKALKAPLRRNADDANVKAGEITFSNINCSGCHTPQLQTTNFNIASLSNVTFFPYTDMLLHDMGAELSDNYTEGNAKIGEWRTTPLWGLGLAKKAQGGEYYLLHDGRAKSIHEAILLHGGEATRSRNAYNNLTDTQKKDLIAFLESL